VYAVYAEDDPRVNDTLPPLCAALWDVGTDVVLESWPGTKHAFHDHSRPERHAPEAAAAVWARALAFLG
jgi:dienelactone hydrolase